MKLIFSIIAIIVVIALALILYDSMEGKEVVKFNDLAKPIMRDERRTTQIAPIRQAQQTVAATQPRVQAVPQQAPQAGNRAAVERIARQVRVQVVKYQETGGSATVDFRWGGDNATLGADFLDAALREGVIRDFDDLHKGQIIDARQQRYFVATYRLKF